MTTVSKCTCIPRQAEYPYSTYSSDRAPAQHAPDEARKVGQVQELAESLPSRCGDPLARGAGGNAQQGCEIGEIGPCLVSMQVGKWASEQVSK